MSAINDFLAAIPLAATSPIALVAYLAAIIAWALLLFRVKTLSTVKETLQNLPENDRISALRSALGDVDVKQFTPIEYLRLQRTKYYYYSFLVFCAVVVVLVSIAVKESIDRDKLTNDLIGRVIDHPDSQYMTAFNAVNNSPGAATNMAEEIEAEHRVRPQGPSDEEVEAVVNRMVSEGRSFEEIASFLRGNSSGGRLQSLNKQLQQYTNKLDGYYGELAECFVRQKCITTARRMKDLCAHTKTIQHNIKQTTNIVQQIPGVMFDETGGGGAMFGNGGMDLYFLQITYPNISELNKFCDAS